MDVNLETAFCGLTFKNPLIVAAGVHGRDGETMKAVSKSGVAAICTKTIVSRPAPDVLPCFVADGSGAMLNSVFGSDRPADYWFTEGIKRAKEGEALVIANLAGLAPEETAELAVKAERAGADMIELPTHCPHMGEILMAMYPGLEMPEPKLTDLEPMKKTVGMVKRAVGVPVVVKLSGSFSHIVREWAVGVAEAGADGIACSDAIGPALSIDIRTGQPTLGGPRGVGGLTGPAIMPITLRMVLEIAMCIDLPIIGVGGASTAADVLRYIMAGATLVGASTAGHLKGVEKYAQMISQLEKLVREVGASSLEEVRGLTVRRIAERRERGLVAVTTPSPPKTDAALCNGCALCEEACAYDAMVVEDIARPDPDTCTGCGLCVSVCPTVALSQDYYT